MTFSSQSPCLRSVLVCALLLAGWPSPTAGQSFETLYSFAATDPNLAAQGWTGALVRAHRAFYGVTLTGGPSNLGTVFRIHPDKGVQVLHAFTGADGAHPDRLFVGRDGHVYGWTAGFAPFGGPVNCGSVFRIGFDLTVTILHVFTNFEAGEPCRPNRLLQASDGNLYGTTFGAYSPNMIDSVFRLTPAGNLTTLARMDHWEPRDLVEGDDGNLYGVTGQGGSTPCAFSVFGCGTIFRIALAAPACPAPAICLPTVLHSPNTPDGMAPMLLVKGMDGNFYGSTQASEPCPMPGACGGGTIFRITPLGSFTRLHTFTPTGQRAQWLIQGSDGALYGGANRVSGDPGSIFKISPGGVFTPLQASYGTLQSRSDGLLYGVVFNPTWLLGAIYSMTSEGTLAPLHVFSGPDGSFPTSLFVGADRALYGTTASGGTSGRGTVFRLDLEPWKDAALEFRPYGLWRLLNGTIWQSIHHLAAEAMVTGDLDGNDLDDLVIDFGPGIGLFAWMNHSTWVLLHHQSPTRLVTGDLDDSGRDDVVADFAGSGLWRWMNHSGWLPLHSLSASHLAVGNVDGAGGDDVVVAFDGFGIYLFANNSSWIGLHPMKASALLTADLDGNGQEDVIIDFPGFGLWIYFNSASWVPLHPFNATRVASGDIDGNGRADLVIDFGATFGLWIVLNNATWIGLHPFSTEGVVLVDRNGNGKDEVLIDFGPVYGLWQYADDTSWTHIHPLSPQAMAVGRLH